MRVKNLKIRLSRVMTVYSGELGCMCGCRGTYCVATRHLATANRIHGHDYEACDVSDTQVRWVVRVLEAQGEVDASSEYAYAVVDGCAYCAYFVPVAHATGVSVPP